MTETNKGGRPLTVLTEEQIQDIEDHAPYMTVEDLSDNLGISHDTFTRITKRDPRVMRAYKKGKYKILSYAKELEEKAFGEKDGHCTSLIFFLKPTLSLMTRKVCLFLLGRRL